jgi:quercetin dioxygenase-like cupin family protein
MPSDARLRPHPGDRFAAPVHLVDLGAAAARLRAEPHDAIGGHRQIALFRRGPVTLVLFTFEAGAHLKEHRTDGVVTIQLLGGSLEVTCDGRTHQLSPGQVVALSPGVLHEIRAHSPSEMLLTVHQSPEEPGAAPSP